MNKPDIAFSRAASARPAPAPGAAVHPAAARRAAPRPAAGRIDGLQYLRALAALAVVVYHAAQYASLDLGAPTGLSRLAAPWAVSGVAIFFALSGFLMARIAPGAAPGRFLLHRLARIYPVFLAIIATYMALSPLLAGQWRTPRLLAITLVPVGEVGWTLGGVEWTLLFETSFYVSVFLVIAAGLTRWITPIAILWLLVIAARMLLAPHADVSLAPTLISLPLASANIAFACGLLVPALTRRLRVHPLFMLTPLIPISCWSLLSEQEFRAAAGAAAAVMVAACLGLPPWKGRLNAVGLRLGDASYALYLIHIPLIIAIMRWAPPGMDWRLVWALCVVLCTLAALPFGWLDLKLYRRLRQRIEGLAEAQALRLAWAYVAIFFALGAMGAVMAAIDQRQGARAATALEAFSSGGAVTGDPSAAAINARLAAADRAFVSPRGGIDQSQRLPDGRIAVQGWAIDLAAPGHRAWIGVFCDGRQVGWAGRTRLRPAEAMRLATEAGLPDPRKFLKLRFGFVVATEPHACRAGASLTLVAADTRGRALALPQITAP